MKKYKCKPEVNSLWDKEVKCDHGLPLQLQCDQCDPPRPTSIRKQPQFPNPPNSVNRYDIEYEGKAIGTAERVEVKGARIPVESLGAEIDLPVDAEAVLMQKRAYKRAEMREARALQRIEHDKQTAGCVMQIIAILAGSALVMWIALWVTAP